MIVSCKFNSARATEVHAAKDAKRCANLQPGDVVIWMKEGKLSSAYRLGRVVEAKPSARDNLVRTVTITFLKRNVLSKSKGYTSKDFEKKTLAVQSLALLVTAEDVERKYWKYEQEQNAKTHMDLVVSNAGEEGEVVG